MLRWSLPALLGDSWELLSPCRHRTDELVKLQSALKLGFIRKLIIFKLRTFPVRQKGGGQLGSVILGDQMVRDPPSEQIKLGFAACESGLCLLQNTWRYQQSPRALDLGWPRCPGASEGEGKAASQSLAGAGKGEGSCLGAAGGRGKAPQRRWGAAASSAWLRKEGGLPFHSPPCLPSCHPSWR